MKFILLLVSIALISAIAEYFFPWYMIVVVPFILGAIINLKGGASFLAGFVGIMTFWFIAALLRDIPNKHILSTRLAELFMLHDFGLFIFVIAFIGGLLGGISAWAGSLVRKYDF